MIKEKNCTIVDVRSKEEFDDGNVEGSINIPLRNMESRLEEIKNLKRPLVLCCASGARSGSAAAFLNGNKIECWNAGSWMDIYFNQKETV